MVTIIESTIGGSSPDYATIEAWLSATELDLVSDDEMHRGLLRAGTYSEVLDVTGATTDATRYRELTFDTGARYDPENDTGAKITGTTAGQTIDAWENYFRFTGICVERGAAATSGICLWVNTNGTGVILDGVTARVAAGSGGTEGILGAVSGPIFRNCLAIREDFDGTGQGITSGGAKMYNCASYGFDLGFEWTDAAGLEIKNCIAEIGTGGDSSFFQYAADTLGTYTYNIAVGDSYAPGTNATQNATSGDVWNDPSNDDFTLKSGSDAIDTAEDLSSDFTTSIDGTDRGTTAANWDAGPFNYSSTPTLTDTGIASGSAVGTETLVGGSFTQTLTDTTGLSETNLYGTEALVHIGGAQTLTDDAIVNSVTLGSETLTAGSLVLTDTAGLYASNLFGTSVLSPGAISMTDDSVVTTTVFGFETLANSGISIVLNTSRTTIVAGEAVDLNIVGSSSSMTTKPLHHILWTWDFGDPLNLDNTDQGPVTSHIFRDDGSYTITVRGRDIHGTDVSETVEITVQDPDNIYPTTATVSIANTGSDFVGAATSSNQQTADTWAAVVAFIDRGYRVELRAGDTFTTTSGASYSPVATSGVALVTKFGVGANPTVDVTSTPTGAVNVLTISDTGYIAIRDIDFTYSGGAHTQALAPIQADHRVDYVSMVDMTADGYSIGFSASASGPEFYAEADHEHVAIHRCENLNVNTSGGWIVTFAGGNHFSYIGGDFGDGDESLVRFTAGSYLCISGNTFGFSGASQSQLKAHAKHPWASSADTSKYWNVTRNHFKATTAPWPVTIGPQNASYDERVEEVIFDGNYYDASTSQDTHVTYGVINMTVRNEIFDGKTKTGYLTGALVGRRGVEPLPTGYEIYHCTVYGSGAGIQAQLLSIGTYGAGAPVCTNHVIDTTNFTTSQLSDGTVTGGGSFIGDADLVDPANQDFSLTFGSGAQDFGISSPVLNSYNANGALRGLSGNTPDSGAYEELPTTQQTLEDIGLATGEVMGSETLTLVSGLQVLNDTAGLASAAVLGLETLVGGSIALTDTALVNTSTVGLETVTSGLSVLGDVAVVASNAIGTEAVGASGYLIPNVHLMARMFTLVPIEAQL